MNIKNFLTKMSFLAACVTALVVMSGCSQKNPLKGNAYTGSATSSWTGKEYYYYVEFLDDTCKILTDLIPDDEDYKYVLRPESHTADIYDASGELYTTFFYVDDGTYIKEEESEIVLNKMPDNVTFDDYYKETENKITEKNKNNKSMFDIF